LITALVQKVKASALCCPLLFCVDGFTAYVGAIQDAFRTPVPTGKAGRPYLRPWDGICIAQVIKRYAQKRVVDIERRLVQGTMAQVEALLRQTQGVAGQINVAFIERLNATSRSRISALVRRGRALARQTETLHPSTASRPPSMYLIGTVYNFCSHPHRLPIYLPGNRHRWVGRTPAMVAGITDRLWTVEDLLSFQTPIPPWTLPKRRGRPTLPKRSLRGDAHDHGQLRCYPD
jgi:hypothetical protein